MSKHRTGAKTLLITDDEEVEAGELNPFSFKEFLRCKNRDQDQDQDQDQTHIKVQELQCVWSKLDNQGKTKQLVCGAWVEAEEEGEGERGLSFQSGVSSTLSLCTEEEDSEKETRFSSKPELQQRKGGENFKGDDETFKVESVTSCGISTPVQQLEEENMLLRRTIRDLQRRSNANERRVQELSEELLQRRRQEEKEAKDLESMVQSVEQNLHLMTKRAVKAENSVSKLKVELQQVQAEVESLRAESSRLKAAESHIVTMTQNAQVASDYLNKMSSRAHSSIRKLLEEAETLHLVSQLLQSIDKISHLNPES
ncbi:endosome-associated-trafficking regulator 1 [Mastacembelus armatus]|uniref:endosome-associated-trafficking regulator 1 n=1 Tax=Mastacembelus armatus TaxID=205130 RepID=UPI000E45DEDB|nr:endosome-associated-trafficking regulator 1 [Mastacembelus armatus]